MSKIKVNRSFLSLSFMIGISVITQILTIMKTSIVAGSFGLSAEMDAYNFANSIVSLIFGLISGSIPTIVIPHYVKKKERKILDGFLTLIYGTLLIAIILILILRFNIVGIFSNRDEMFVNIACNVLVIVVFAQYLSSFCGVVTAYFQCIDKYNIPKITNLIAQSAVLFCLVLFRNINIYQYTIIIAIGFAVNFFLDVTISFKYKWRFKPTFAFKDPEIVRLLKSFLPIVVSCSVYNISLFIDSTIASRLETGMLSVLSYSNQISGIINTVLVANLTTFIYPKIIKKIVADKDQTYFWKQSNLFHSIMVLLAIGFIVVGKEGISLLFENGLFDSNAVNSVFIGSSIYIVGMQTNIVRDMIYRYFYAQGDTKTPAINSVLVSITNIIFSILLVQIIGFYGIIIGTVFSSLVSLVIIIIRFEKQIGIQYKISKIIIFYFKNNLIGLISLLIVMITKHIFPIEINVVAIITYGVEAILIYSALTFVINKETINALKVL